MYDGFISYSHAADGLLAPRLQAALQRFAKPWWKRRAVRIFRDESSLSANPHLWSSITEALDTSGWFVLLLSPDAARSEWVNQEIAYWVDNRDPKKILPVATDGTFGWANGVVTGDAVPDALGGVFSEEPRWVDVRWAKGEEQLDLQDPRFADAVADIASTIRGIPKDDLASEEVRQHRRTVRTAWAAGALVTVLAIAAAGFGVSSARNADEAERQAEIADRNAAAEAAARADADSSAAEARSQRDRAEEEAARANANEALATSRELAASAINVLEDDPELATLLAIQALDEAPASADVPVEVVSALWQAGGANRLVASIPASTEQYVSVSQDGTQIAVSGDQRLTVMDASTLEEIWTYEETSVDTFTYSEFSSDGRLAVGIIDSASISQTTEPDNLPNRIVILDAASGEVEHTILLPDCTRSELPTWSFDASLLALTSGADGCVRNGVVHWLEVLDTNSWETIAFLPFEVSENGPLPRWDQSGRLFALRPFEEVVVFEADSFEITSTLSWGGIGDVSRDGTTMVLGLPVDAPLQSSYVVDTETGFVRDVLPSPSSPSVPGGILLSDDGRWVFVGAAGRYTRVYELATGDLVRRLSTGNVESLAYDAGSERLFTTGGRAGLKVWDLRPTVIGVEETGDLGAFGLVGSNTFTTIRSRGAFNAFDLNATRWSLRFFDLSSGRLADEVVEDFRMLDVFEDGTVLGLDSSINRNVVLDPDTGDRVVIDDLCSETEEHGTGVQYCAGPADPWAFVISATLDGELLAVGRTAGAALTGDVLSIDPSTGQIMERRDERLPLTLRGVVTEDWVAGGAEAGMEIVSRASGELLYSGPSGGLFELSPTGALLAFETGQTDVVVLDTGSWSDVMRVEASARVRGISFAPDERRLAVGDLDSLSIVDVGTGRVIQDLGLAGVSDVHWIDDETVVVGTNDGVFGTLSISTEAFLESTRAALGRSFTPQECELYRIDPCPSLDEMRGR
jgi:WD40 repeat protein